MTDETSQFVVTTSPHGMPSLELRPPTLEQREFLRYVLACDLIGDEKYELRQQARAFLQHDDPDYVLVEFWSDNYKPFVQWLNDNFKYWVCYWQNGEMK